VSDFFSFLQKRGSQVNITQNANLDGQTIIESGTLILSGAGTFAGGIISANTNTDTSVNKTDNGILTFGKDAANANFFGTFNQTGGTTNVYGQFFNSALDNIVSNSTLNFYREDSDDYGTIAKLNLSDSQINLTSDAQIDNSVAITDLSIDGVVSFNVNGGASLNVLNVIDAGATDLIKKGAGTMNVAQSAGWAGQTIVESGTLALSGAASFGTSTDLILFGGATFDDGAASPAFSLLEVRGKDASYIGDLNIANATVNFLLPDSTVNNDKILDVSAEADITNSDIKVGITGTNRILNGGERILLIDAGTLVGDPSETESVGMQGLTLVYDFDLFKEGNELWAEVIKAALNPQTKTFSQGRAASIAGISQIADLVARTGIESAVTSAQERKGIAFFSGIEGGFSRYKTGSHIDLTGASLAAGIAKAVEVKKLDGAQLTFGGFVEFGANSYDAYAEFDGKDIKGGGDNQYYGAGILSRLSLSNNFYGELSLRGGLTKGSFDSSDMGQPASYETDAPYYGGHIGAGYIAKICESLTLNSYAKYLYVAQSGEDVNLPTGEKIKFQSTDSGKILIGARLNKNAFYGGLAYEYELNGKVEAEISGMAVDSPTLEGGSGMAEAGYAKDLGALKIEVGVQGYLGTRTGVIGKAKIGYEF
jgi:autotransporter-associated beta strand protein